MKLEKAVSCLWGIGLSFLVSFGAMGCIVTAFDMGVALWQGALWCALAALVCGVCFTLPLKLLPPGLGALALGFLWQKGSLFDSVEALLNRLTRQYDKAYGWGIIRWGFRTADDMEPTMLLILCVLGAVTAMAIAWAVCRRKTALPGVLLSFLPVAACFVVTDTVPDVPWLYLWLLGVLVLMLTNRVRRQEEKQGNRLCAMAAPCVALALLVLLAAVPQDRYSGQETAKRMADAVLNTDTMQLLMGQEAGALSTGAASGGVDLTAVGYRVTSEAKIMEITADFDGEIYLRGRAMNTYDGESWSDTDVGAGMTALEWPSWQLQDAGEVRITTRYAHRMLYTPYYISASQLRDVTVGIENEKKLTEYSFSCQRLTDPGYFSSLYPAENGWTLSSDWTPELLEQFIDLPDDVKKWAEPLAQEITGSMVSPYHKALAIAEYVRNSAAYDTATARMPVRQDDFVRWFLNDSDTGYCIHFASAAAVLLQASGIPARYVTGYTAQVTAGQTVEVTAAQAHAWTEYWLPGFGWTVLEATPADLTDVPAQTEAPDASAATDATEQTLPDATEQPGQTQSTPEVLGEKGILTVLAVLAAVLTLVALCEGQRALRRSLWAKKRSRGSTNDQAVTRWQQAARLARLLGETPDRELFLLAQKARFSQHSLTQQELAQFDRYEEAAARRLKQRSVFHRFYYRIILAVY